VSAEPGLGAPLLKVAAATAIDKLLLAVCAGEPESVTLAVKLNVPELVGVPEIAPVVAAIVTPGGSEPDEIDQL
jgi:hypothetical protein